MAGNSPEKVIEVHGTMRKVVCMGCGMTAPMQKALDRVRAGEDDPPCRDCGGILKSATISFGQALVPEVIDARDARRAAGRPVLRRSAPACRSTRSRAWCRSRASAGAKIVILNAEPTPFDDIADAVFRESISQVLPGLLGER